MALLRKQLSSNFKSSRTTNIHYSKPSNLPPGAITDFVWKDYCTSIFRNIQELGNVSYEDYMLSVCNHETLMELALRGYCGRPFYLRHDTRFVIKILRKNEANVLMEMLPSYQRHLEKYNNSLLAKYYGLHASRPGAGGQKVYFVVMENVLQSEVQIHRQYDLKGSSQRSPTEVGTLPRLTLKDSDFDLCFYLDPSTRSHILEQIKIDCKFLEEQGIMGYSMLLGVHIEPPSKAKKDDKNQQQPGKAESFNERHTEVSIQERNGSDTSCGEKLEPRHRRDPTLSDFFADPSRPGTRIGASIQAHAVQVFQNNVKEGSTRSRKPRATKKYSVLLYIGIIDFLHNYNVIKRIEHAFKSLQYDAKEISTVRPDLYSTRFQDFLCKVFLTEDIRNESLS